jgi:DNA-binding beta-propeller fold protein YncE
MNDLKRRSLVLGLALLTLVVAGCGGGGGPGGDNSSHPDVATNLVVTQTLPTNQQEVLPDLSDPGLESHIRVFFSEMVMSATAIDPTNTFNYLTSDVNILNSGMERMEGVATLANSNKTLVFQPSGDLANGQYTVTVTRDVMNFQGGRLNSGVSDHRSSFTVGTDIFAPVLRNTFPAANQKNVAKDSRIILTFNETLNRSTVTNTSITVVDGSANPPVNIAGSLVTDLGAFEIIFTPDAGTLMPPNATIVVTINGGAGGVSDAVGNPFEGDIATPGLYQFQFETVKEPPPPNNPLTIDPNTFDALLYFADSTSIGSLQEGLFLNNTLDLTLWGAGNPVPNSMSRIGQPGEIIFDPRFGPTDGHTYAYIIDRATKSVAVVGTRDSKVVWRWRDLPDPRGLAIAPNGITLYVTNYAADSLSFLDVGSINVGMALASDRLKDLSKQNNRTDLGMGRGPIGAAHAPDASLVFVGNSIENTCTLINTATATINTSFAVGTRPTDVAATFNFPNIGRFAFLTCLGGGNDDNGSVSLYWSTPNGLQASITGFENPMECIYDRGASIWTANSGGNQTKQLTLAFAGGGFAATILPTITASIKVGASPTGVTMESFYPYFNAATRTIISACRGSSELVFLDNAQPSRPTYSIMIPGVWTIASYYDQ